MNYGSKKPLRWRTPSLEEHKDSESPEWSIHKATKCPPTRSGVSNGHHPLAKPMVNPDYSDPLDKAVLRPVKYGPGRS